MVCTLKFLLSFVYEALIDHSWSLAVLPPFRGLMWRSCWCRPGRAYDKSFKKAAAGTVGKAFGKAVEGPIIFTSSFPQLSWVQIISN